jgi:predicted NBD/HSP70 family sugar kinase
LQGAEVDLEKEITVLKLDEVGKTIRTGENLNSQKGLGIGSRIFIQTDVTSESPTQTTRELLRIVRASQPIPRVAVARRLGVHRRRITVLVRPLIDAGVLREGMADPTLVRRVGRPPIGLSFRNESEFLIGVNIGVRQTRVGAATVDGITLSEESFATANDPALTLDEVGAAIERQRTRFAERELKVIGISVAGPTDAERRTLLCAPHLGWRNLAVAERLSVLNPDAAILVENNATAAAVYEAQRRRRISRSAGDFVLVRAGTGIGVGLVLGGEVYRGAANADIAGEFGHMTIVAGGKACPCGNFGCWERYASASSAVALYIGDSPRSSFRSSLRFSEIVARAAAGERRACTTLERVGMHLGIGIGNVISGLGVPNVVLSGELVHGWQFIESSARAAIAMSLGGRLSRWSLEPGESHGAELGGALEVAIEHYLLTIVGRQSVAA